MNTFVTFKLDQENINELFITLIRKYPLYFQEPERIKEIIYLFDTKKSDLVTLIIESDYVDRQYRDSYYSYFSQKYSKKQLKYKELVLTHHYMKQSPMTRKLRNRDMRQLDTLHLQSRIRDGKSGSQLSFVFNRKP